MRGRETDRQTNGQTKETERKTEERQLVECCFTSTETVGLLGTVVQDVHLDFHTALELGDIQTNRYTVISSMHKCVWGNLIL